MNVAFANFAMMITECKDKSNKNYRVQTSRTPFLHFKYERQLWCIYLKEINEKEMLYSFTLILYSGIYLY